MKLILLHHLSGDKSYAAGEEFNAEDAEALRLIEKGIAKAKTKKEHDEALARVEKKRAEEEEIKTKALAIQKERELKDEADALLDELLKIVSALESIDEGYRDEFLAHFHGKFVNDKAK